MKRIIILLFILTCLSGCQKTEEIIESDFLDLEEVSSYDTTSYYLDVYLDTNNQKLSVTGSIVFVNDVKDFEELNITIAPNAYNKDGHSNNVSFDYLKVNNQEYTVTFSGEDKTNIHLDMDEPLRKDENILIEFRYAFTFWDFGRIMADDDYVISMFFYPYVAMFDEEGWHTETYAFGGESYYNDIGNYFVRINHPEHYTLACSGYLVSQEIYNTRRTTNYQLYNARDFSFSASSAYVSYQHTVRDITVEIHSISDLSEFELRQVKNYIEDSFNTFEHYIGEYPYDHYTLEIGKIFGMESTGIGYVHRNISEETIVHEILHQWLYSIIGNNQADYSIIDESLTTFVTGIYFKEVYGEVGELRYYSGRSSLRKDLLDLYDECQGLDMVSNVNDYGDYYAYIVYYHGPTIFKYYLDEFLDGNYDTFKLFLQSYYDTYKYDVVTLEEMFILIEETTNQEIAEEWFTLMFSEFQPLENRP